MGLSVGIFLPSHLQAEISVLPVLVAAILDFRLPVWSYSIATTCIELLDPKNTGVAVGISFLSRLQKYLSRVTHFHSFLTKRCENECFIDSQKRISKFHIAKNILRNNRVVVTPHLVRRGLILLKFREAGIRSNIIL
jgi:hypothetical protein